MFPDQLRRNHPGILEHFLSASRSHRFFIFFFSCSREESFFFFFFCHKTIVMNTLFYLSARESFMMMMHRIEKSNLRTLRAKEGKKNERQKLHRDEKNFKNTSDSSFHFRENFHSCRVLFFLELNGHFTKTSSSLQSKFTRRVFILRNKPRKTALIKEDKKNFR